MSSSGSFILGRVDVGSVGAIAKFVLVALAGVGRLPKPVTSLGINVGITDPELFFHHALLERWFLSGLGPAYLLFGASV